MDEFYTRRGLRSAAFVAMMKLAYLGHCDHFTLVAYLDRPGFRAVHAEGQMAFDKDEFEKCGTFACHIL